MEQVYKEYTLNKINEAKVGEEPFYHMYIEDILHEDLYKALKEKSDYYNNSRYLTTRLQDNKSFVNNRYSIAYSKDSVLKTFYNLFSDKDIKLALLSKFFVNPDKFINSISVFKEELEFVYTKGAKFQNIHVDIPSKYISTVFYFPDTILSEQEQLDNGTILYNKDIQPIQKSKYKPNSVCIFAQHFYSYHGFNTTIDRNSLVLFYVNNDTIIRDLQPTTTSLKERTDFKNSIFDKLREYPLIEYKNKNLRNEYDMCKINSNKGRVMI